MITQEEQSKQLNMDILSMWINSITISIIYQQWWNWAVDCQQVGVNIFWYQEIYD